MSKKQLTEDELKAAAKKFKENAKKVKLPKEEAIESVAMLSTANVELPEDYGGFGMLADALTATFSDDPVNKGRAMGRLNQFLYQKHYDKKEDGDV